MQSRSRRITSIGSPRPLYRRRSLVERLQVDALSLTLLPAFALLLLLGGGLTLAANAWWHLRRWWRAILQGVGYLAALVLLASYGWWAGEFALAVVAIWWGQAA